MKLIITLIISIIWLNQVESQYYNNLDDYFGNNLSWSFAKFDSASAGLINILPDPIQDSFRILTKNFYLHEIVADSNFNNATNKVFLEATTASKYFILICRIASTKSPIAKYYIKINLPNYGSFSCLNENELNLIENSVLVYLSPNINKLTIDNSVIKNEIISVNYFKERLEDIVVCCDSNIRMPGSCSECLNEDDIKNYYIKNKFEAEEISIYKNEYNVPIEFEPIENSNILDFGRIMYIRNDTIFDPFNQLREELDSLNIEEDVAFGVLLSNKSLCYDIEGAPIRTMSNEAIDLFNSDFIMPNKKLVIVYHLWLNPSVGEPDILFKKYLYADYGTLYTKDAPLDINNIGNPNESTPKYPLTNLNECNNGTKLYEVYPDENGIYYGYKLINCVWVKSDIAEFIFPAPYPFYGNYDQYNIGRKIAEIKIRQESRMELGGSSINVMHPYYYPCYHCYKWSVGKHKEITTEKLINNFFTYYGIGEEHQQEKDILFNSFVYGFGQPVVWTPDSYVSKELKLDNIVSSNMLKIENVIKEWLSSHENLDGLISSEELRPAISEPKPNFNNLLKLWAFEMFGGIQAGSVKIVRFKLIKDNSCGSKFKFQCEFLYSLYDNFGLGPIEKFYLPGVPAQWVLQHYRNDYLYNYAAFSPVVNHIIEFNHTFEFCQ